MPHSHIPLACNLTRKLESFIITLEKKNNSFTLLSANSVEFPVAPVFDESKHWHTFAGRNGLENVHSIISTLFASDQPRSLIKIGKFHTFHHFCHCHYLFVDYAIIHVQICSPSYYYNARYPIRDYVSGCQNC